MQRIPVLFAASVAAMLFAAHDPAASAPARRSAGVSPSATLLLRFDADSDNVVTREEMEAGLKADYAAADTDGNACLSPPEVRAENVKRLERDTAQASPLVDWNLDGCVDMREFSNTAHSYFDLADRGKDNRVTANELRGPSMPIPPRVAQSRQDRERGTDQRGETPATPALSGYAAGADRPGSGSGLPGSYAGY